MSLPERTPAEWFEEAARCHAEAHQGCAWCGCSNNVYHRMRGQVQEYHCGQCDFYTSFDEAIGRYFMTPGYSRGRGPAPLTMVGKGWLSESDD